MKVLILAALPLWGGAYRAVARDGLAGAGGPLAVDAVLVLPRPADSPSGARACRAEGAWTVVVPEEQGHNLPHDAGQWPLLVPGMRSLAQVEST